ncbi:hypothetical protein VTL71DRAFT_588 [Oculimacula yallundae]|uniref:Uncharacterized protein n=1 Tax=Oculimacula yallundae TaxID=86028 RepID=A0ABR4D0L6_9HELO
MQNTSRCSSLRPILFHLPCFATPLMHLSDYLHPLTLPIVSFHSMQQIIHHTIKRSALHPKAKTGNLHRQTTFRNPKSFVIALCTVLCCSALSVHAIMRLVSAYPPLYYDSCTKPEEKCTP